MRPQRRLSTLTLTEAGGRDNTNFSLTLSRSLLTSRDGRIPIPLHRLPLIQRRLMTAIIQRMKAYSYLLGNSDSLKLLPYIGLRIPLLISRMRTYPLLLPHMITSSAPSDPLFISSASRSDENDGLRFNCFRFSNGSLLRMCPFSFKGSDPSAPVGLHILPFITFVFSH